MSSWVYNSMLTTVEVDISRSVDAVSFTQWKQLTIDNDEYEVYLQAKVSYW